DRPARRRPGDAARAAGSARPPATPACVDAGGETRAARRRGLATRQCLPPIPDRGPGRTRRGLRAARLRRARDVGRVGRLTVIERFTSVADLVIADLARDAAAHQQELWEVYAAALVWRDL